MKLDDFEEKKHKMQPTDLRFIKSKTDNQTNNKWMGLARYLFVNPSLIYDPSYNSSLAGKPTLQHQSQQKQMTE